MLKDSSAAPGFCSTAVLVSLRVRLVGFSFFKGHVYTALCVGSLAPQATVGCFKVRRAMTSWRTLCKTKGINYGGTQFLNVLTLTLKYF